MQTSDVDAQSGATEEEIEAVVCRFADALIDGLMGLEFPPEVAPPAEPSQPRLA